MSCSPQSEHKPWASMWFLRIIQTTKRVPCCSRTTDTDKAMRGCPERRDHHSLRRRRSLSTSIWLQAVAHPCNDCGVQKKMSEFLGLEIQMVVSLFIGAGN